MVSRALVILAASLAAVLVLAPAAPAPPPHDDRYIVVLEPGADPGEVSRQHRERHGAEPDHVYRRVLNGYAARVPAARVEALRSDPRVAYVEPDAVVRATATQSDAPWGLDRVDQRALPLNRTYTSETSGAGVRAYVVDTGIRASHRDLGGRVASGFTAISDGRGTDDCDGHGTHVAGTVGGGAYGVAKAATLVPVRVLGCDGTGTTSGVIAGVDWITRNGARPAVANMSLGGPASTALDTAVRSSIRSGVTYAVAAGNDGVDACGDSPARVAEGLTIGATGRSDARPTWSNWGACVDFFAPGVDITSAIHTDDTGATTFSGTSMAAPHVAGAAALVLEQRPTATPAEVESALSGALTRGVVTSARSTNNHLLFVGPAPAASEPAQPSGNTTPQARFTSSCTGLTCTFDGSASTDPDGSVATYSWSFGDGTTGSGATASRTYAAGGTYDVTLTVTDDRGAVASDTQQVPVTAPARSATEAPAPAPAPSAPAPAPAPAPSAPAPAPAPIGAPPPPVLATSLLPTAARIASGSAYRGRRSVTRLRRNDASRLEVSGRRRGGATRAELQASMSVTPAQRSSLRQLGIRVDANVSASRATLGVRVFNWSRRRFETIVAPRRGITRDRLLSWRTSRGIGAYVSPAGEIRVAVRGTHTRAFRARTDQVRVVLGY